MKTNSDSSHYLARCASRKKFVLSRRGNERGQVAIFVALIFQVVFVFFALLINVGLLVHHKINLQHSTDLAAYYGAMKQAEQMNAIAHINFQMRQAWKLLTWRYRVLGTFGFIPRTGGINQKFPFNSETTAATRAFTFVGTNGMVADVNNPTLNGGVVGSGATDCRQGGANYKIPNEAGFIGIQDIPFFCIGHSGFRSWPQNESNCQLSCQNMLSGSVINALPTAPSRSIYGNDTSSSVMNFTNIANGDIERQCKALGPAGARLLTKFLTAYAVESTARSETIKMLAQNLSGDVGQMVDLDGASIQAGSKRTFENNLTGANFSGLPSNGFIPYNGLNSNSCRFQGGSSPGSTEFLKKIEFQILNFYIQNCEWTGNAEFSAGPVYDSRNPTGLSKAFDSLDPTIKDRVTAFLSDPNKFSIGYEKNPSCIEYFAVKTMTEPNIPFLPLAKIRLEATAVAKPFGGSIGPSYGTSWPFGAPASLYDDNNPLTKTDKALPFRVFNPAPNSTITESIYTQPNFSLFVGDQLGVRNLDYLATYHSMLAMRDIAIYPTKTYNNNQNTSGQILNNNTSVTGPTWPDFDNWKDIEQLNFSDLSSYDSLASSNPGEAGTRAIEITAIAPNQFDISHYSIDPDFYNNYYLKIYNNFTAIKQAAGNTATLTAKQVRADFGAKGMTGGQSFASLDEKSFSVKDQIYLKNIVLDKAPNPGPSYTIPGATDSKYRSFLNYLVSFQTSLLTGWTFLSFRDYVAFPDGDINKNDKTMTFGKCDDPWNNSNDYTSDAAKVDEASFRTPMNKNADLPPVPGNCVTGGRTGYSVKLVSPSVVLDAGKILNPMPFSSFTFPP